MLVDKKVFIIFIITVLSGGCTNSSTSINQIESEKVQINSSQSSININKMLSEAEKGDAQAQYNLGVLYTDGYGHIKKNINEAIKWYILSAKQGYTNAQYNLGYLYSRALS